jgi:hypothetical protein
MYRSNPESRGRPDLAHDSREDSVGPGNDDVVWSSPHASQRQADRSDIGLARSVPHRLADALWRQPCSERAPIIDVGINPPARGRDDYEAASPFPTNGGGERVDGPGITPGRPVWSSLVASLARWEWATAPYQKPPRSGMRWAISAAPPWHRMDPGKAFSIMLGRATARRVWVKGLWNRPRASAHADDYLSIGGAGR